MTEIKASIHSTLDISSFQQSKIVFTANIVLNQQEKTRRKYYLESYFISGFRELRIYLGLGYIKQLLIQNTFNKNIQCMKREK